MIFCSLFPAVAGYYLLREHYNPGYLKLVSENELGGRFLKSLEGHDEEHLFYFNNLVDVRFADWYPLIVTSVLIGFTIKDIRIKKLTVFCMITIITFLLIISSAKTKVEWYDLPLYPFLCIMAAITLHWIFTSIKENKIMSQHFYLNAIPLVFLFLVFLKPYEKIIDKVYAPSEYEIDFYRISFFLRTVIKDPDPNHTYDVCYDNYDKSHILIYVYMLNDKGKKSSIRDCRYLKAGDRVIAIQQHEKEFIEKFYTYEVLETYYDIKTYKIIESLQ
ncbi:MAG: hypothetical protein IPP71_11135 [Bacteroidetes bacterium]|nr:hypothetical protein [Bacteroidota bacterium]